MRGTPWLVTIQGSFIQYQKLKLKKTVLTWIRWFGKNGLLIGEDGETLTQHFQSDV